MNNLHALLSEEFPDGNWEIVELGEGWLAQFYSFKSSAFRLETLQAYAEPSEAEALSAFEQGIPVSTEYISEWCNMVRDHTASGKKMERVHLVELPLSRYLQFEIETAYPHTSEAGENILLLEISVVPDSLKESLTKDFWLFDENRVMVQHYSPEGTLLYSSLASDQDTVDYFKGLRDQVLSLGVDFAEFYAECSMKEA